MRFFLHNFSRPHLNQLTAYDTTLVTGPKTGLWARARLILATAIQAFVRAEFVLPESPIFARHKAEDRGIPKSVRERVSR